MSRTAFVLAVAFFLIICAAPGLAQTPTYKHSLTWQDNSDNEDGFKIERKSSPTDTFGEIGTVGANVTAYTDTVLDGLQRCYRVRAFNAAGDSAFTNEACGLSKPRGPLSLKVIVTIVIAIP